MRPLTICRGDDTTGQAGKLVTQAVRDMNEHSAALANRLEGIAANEAELNQLRRERTQAEAMVRDLKQQFEDERRNSQERLAGMSRDWERTQKRNQELESVVALAKAKLARSDKLHEDITVERDKSRKLVELVKQLEKQRSSLVSAQMKWEEEREDLMQTVRQAGEQCASLRDQVSMMSTHVAAMESEATRSRSRIRELEDALRARSSAKPPATKHKRRGGARRPT
ncbi:Uncharacterized protein PBTT_00248 [Plasmodiophora brassicae]|uniref:Uncharacterized protein n=1 Tax=Plasmodiophora brassicae TaxID=37360 RepID=A0A0G4J4S8_PLABS|nr:hypothetical protein PBRA_002541 [Plasmodiophora brassicae]